MSSEQIRLQVSPKLFGSTAAAGSHRWSSNEFQTLGLATENVWVPKVLYWYAKTYKVVLYGWHVSTECDKSDMQLSVSTYVRLVINAVQMMRVIMTISVTAF